MIVVNFKIQFYNYFLSLQTVFATSQFEEELMNLRDSSMEKVDGIVEGLRSEVKVC